MKKKQTKCQVKCQYPRAFTDDHLFDLQCRVVMLEGKINVVSGEILRMQGGIRKRKQP